MEEKVIVLDERKYESKQDVISEIKEKLNFPYYAGMNLDALNDCLSDIFYPVTFIIIPRRDDGLSDWMQEVYTVLTEVSEYSSNFNCNLLTAPHSDNNHEPESGSRSS